MEKKEAYILNVIGHLRFDNKVSLIAEEEFNDIKKGQVVSVVTRTTYKYMALPKSVRIFINPFGKQRIETIRWNHEI